MAAAPSIGRATAVEAPAVAREAEATRLLYERYASQIYGFCLHKLGSREEAEDAVQTTFLNAFRGLARGVVPQAESAWLFKIAENVCLSRHRSSFRRRRVEAPTDLEALQDVIPGHAPDSDELVGLERVLAGMPETQRRAILLREWQGLSYREIADEMDLTQAAVETLIFRARRSLAQGLETLDGSTREPLRKRVRRGVDSGGLIAGLKAFLGSAFALKTATATVVAVTSATVLAADPPVARRHRSPVDLRTAAAHVHKPAVPVRQRPAAATTAPRAALLARRAAAARHAALDRAARDVRRSPTPAVASAPAAPPVQPTVAPPEPQQPQAPPPVPVAVAPAAPAPVPAAAPAPAPAPAPVSLPGPAQPPAVAPKGDGGPSVPPGQEKKSPGPPTQQLVSAPVVVVPAGDGAGPGDQGKGHGRHDTPPSQQPNQQQQGGGGDQHGHGDNHAPPPSSPPSSAPIAPPAVVVGTAPAASPVTVTVTVSAPAQPAPPKARPFSQAPPTVAPADD